MKEENQEIILIIIIIIIIKKVKVIQENIKIISEITTKIMTPMIKIRGIIHLIKIIITMILINMNIQTNIQNILIEIEKEKKIEK